jgi:hypothetical protein
VLTAVGTTGRFSINLIFPDQELPDQPFWVTTSMTVPTLVRSLVDLMDVPPPLSLFVGPEWDLLDHDGFIVSRFLSDGITPCPYLQPGSFLRVVSPGFSGSSVSSTVLGLANSSRLAGLPSLILELDNSEFPPDDFGGESSPRLVQTEFPDLSDLGLVSLSRPHISPSLPSHSSRIWSNHGSFIDLQDTDENRASLDGVPSLTLSSETTDCAISNLQRNGENRCDVGSQVIDVVGSVSSGLQMGRQCDSNDEVGSQVIDVFRNVSPGLQMGRQHSPQSSSVAGNDALSSSLEWGQSHGPLLPDPNFAPTPWRRFEWGDDGEIPGPEPEPTAWGRSRLRSSPSSSSSSRLEARHSSSSSADHDIILDECVPEDESSSSHDSKRLRFSRDDGESPLVNMRRAIVQRQVDVMNTSSAVGGETPREQIYGTRSSREIAEEPAVDGKESDVSSWPQVTRRERFELLRKFRTEQKLRRRSFKLQVKETWDAEMAENKENFLHEGDSKEDSSLPRFPVSAEDAAEAYENYFFDRMQQYDRDAADLLVDFRSSLHVVPSWNDQQERVNPVLMERRTNNLWEGLRRVYFEEKEAEPSHDDQDFSHEEVMDNLRREIAEIDERLRRRRPPPDSGRSLPPLPRDDGDDGGEPPRSVAHTNVHPDPRHGGALVAFETVPGIPPSSERMTGPGDATNFQTEAVCLPGPIRKLVLLTKRVLRRIMAAKESLFKFGTFVPKNDREAESSPEAARWRAGRTLEWVRLCKEGTFDGNWTWETVQKAYPHYKKSDLGFLFYVYDFKFSGEHRVRLVFDGSRQSASTFKETYAPTVRAESVRLFHIYCVEEGLHIGQYDVPQAFLKADIDHDIFAYPPKGQSDFPGQILKLRKALYGGKQSAYLWFTLMNSFILSLGFKPSPLDSCFYQRADAVLILYCDDLRIGASPEVLAALHISFSEKFSVTTAPGDRFLGMDTSYDPIRGILKLSMKSYIETTMERFHSFDLSQGYPYRELVGCLLWVTLNVMGPELLRVKDLARLSNSFGEAEYNAALKVLKRVFVRRCHGIVIFRHGAGREVIPSSVRPPSPLLHGSSSGENVESSPSGSDDIGNHISSFDNEVMKKSLCQGKSLLVINDIDYKVEDNEHLDIQRIFLPVNSRYSLLAYGDASFAVGDSKQSVSGFVIYLNGVPLIWGSLKQTVVVDSSSSAEFVAASITCKQLLHAENMVGFLGFSCPKPYKLYTDSKACYHIASNPSKLGNVRHLQIRYHMVRCYVSLGDVEMCFCITEEMLADLLTKVVVGAQDHRLSLRFYSLVSDSSGKVSGADASMDEMD